MGGQPVSVLAVICLPGHERGGVQAELGGEPGQLAGGDQIGLVAAWV